MQALRSAGLRHKARVLSPSRAARSTRRQVAAMASSTLLADVSSFRSQLSRGPPNWRRGETREGAAQQETTKHSGNGSSKGPTHEQQGPAAIQDPSNPTAKGLLDKPAPHYVVFSSDLDATTQLPWCPDCVRTLPAIQEGVAAAGGSLLEVRVGPRSAWRDPLHPFRSDPELKVSGIPTLAHVKPDGSLGERAGPELERASGPQEAAQIVAAFIKRTAA